MITEPLYSVFIAQASLSLDSGSTSEEDDDDDDIKSFIYPTECTNKLF
jgi:hypothetical protein